MEYAEVLDNMWKEGKKKGAFVFRKDDILTTPYRALVFTVLSARAKDENTYKVCKRLFAVADTPGAVAALGGKKLQNLVYSIGFYKAKTKKLLGMSRMIVEDFGGEVPGTREGLMSLPGVGRKTANIILNREFGKATLAVDVHVHRIANRLGWVKTKKPLDTEKKLLEILPENLVRKCNRAMVGYGQTVCLPRNPKCKECKVREFCKRVGLPKTS
ncbi:endonuclease III [Candidatus Micrarchaeota archaeon]|nr:endonuclease III [Candidatus Micrarchaeota archaeon]MBD3417461.1 endonuclease III [Candidatus Micrarchaeota archaeon]